MALHLIKLCVGIDTVEQLEASVARRAGGAATPLGHVTRQTPRRGAEILDGGSLYWVIRGVVQCRQRVLALDPVDRDGTPHCRIVLEPILHRTRPMQRRPFQGWRYLPTADAPADMAEGEGGEDLPPELQRQLIEIGAW